VGPAPGGGLPLQRHCDRPQDVLPLPQQTSSDGDVGGTKPLPPARTRSVPAAVAPCMPSGHCCALVAAVVRVPCVATTAQMLRSSSMARAAAAASACCCGWSGCCLRCSGGTVMLSTTSSLAPARSPTAARSCRHHSGSGLGPHTRTALPLHPTPARPPPAHAPPPPKSTVRHLQHVHDAAGREAGGCCGAAPCSALRAETRCCPCRMTFWMLRAVGMRARCRPA
jgi:hypothetical protein